MLAGQLFLPTCTRSHILMVLLSTIIAAIGLLRDNGTILIEPNMALALATALEDTPLALIAVNIIRVCGS